eukprot:scaffold37828_cov130-Skeletonema_marinoi.AAC.1
MVWWFHGRQLVALRIPEVTRRVTLELGLHLFSTAMNQLICFAFAGALEDDQVERCSGVLSMVH